MQQQESEPCEYCWDVLDLDAARLCQQTFDLEPHHLSLPLSPPPIALAGNNPFEIALPLSPPMRFDRLIDMSNASFVSRPQNSTHNERKSGTKTHEPVSPKPIPEPKKDDSRKYISIRELFDNDDMDDARKINPFHPKY
ncbi:hypothetical protein N7G274_007971 [Stereocaulon virgatum]|uniref:Uncharacterized protein n=1 Tax=Stereocaulon virgatum TaxID=373712 RepID=A0ABR4A2P8_9LECA